MIAKVCKQVVGCLKKIYNDRDIYSIVIDDTGLEVECPFTDSEKFHDQLTIISNFSLSAFQKLRNSVMYSFRGIYDLHLIHLGNLYYETINTDPPEKQFSQYYQLKKAIENKNIENYLGDKYAIFQDKEDTGTILMSTTAIEKEIAINILDSIKSSFNHQRMIKEEIINPDEKFNYCTYFSGNLEDEFRPSILYETDKTTIIFGEISSQVYATFFTQAIS